MPWNNGCGRPAVAASKNPVGSSNRWRLVIDTSILRSASERPSPDPRGPTCGKLLRDILEICHHAVFTPESSAEWNRHRSRFAMTWRRAMTARKKLHFLDDACRDADLRSACERLFQDDGAPDSWEEVEKDLHLAEAALATDKIVLSVERRIHECFRWACSKRGARKLREIHWFHPVKNPRRLSRLLDGDLPARSRLGS